jgi:hypothetical protein
VIALEAVTLNGGGQGGDRVVVEACRQRAEQMAANLDPRGATTLAAWEQPIDVEFVEASLQEVLDRIQTTQGIELRMEQVADPERIEGPEWPFTYSAKGIVTRQVLRQIERHFDLTFLVEGDSMVVRLY